MKLSTALLLLSSLYLASALSNNPWTLIQQGIADNSPFAAELNQIGGQNNLGQAFDSHLFNVVQKNISSVSQGNTYNSSQGNVSNVTQGNSSNTTQTQGNASNVTQGNSSSATQGNSSNATQGNVSNFSKGHVSNVYNSWYQYAVGQAFNYSAELQLALDNITIDSQYVISIDNVTNARQIVWWSFAYLYGEANGGPAGINITYNADTGNVTVSNFTGIEEWVAYQEGNSNGLNNTIYEGLNEYRYAYLGYVAQDPSNYTANATLGNAVNATLKDIASAANLTNVNLTHLSYLDTYEDNNGNLWVRSDANITSDTNSGEVVAVVSCAAGGDCSDAVLQYWWWESVILG